MKQLRFLLFISVLFYSCAIQVAPEGGDKDVKPPVVLHAEPENFSSNIKPTDIKITFDEFVVLKDVNGQLVSSPLLKNTPETKLRKKSLYIHLSDTLSENTTYTLNFGNSIVDNNEANILENYQYVFSTGSVIDSLKMKGKVETAFDHKTEKDVLVMLYRNTTDSIPFLERPLYAGRTKENGEFEIDNISPGKYKVVCMKEADANFLYSRSGERIGFTDELIEAGNESVRLYLFDEVPQLRYSKTISEFAGKVSLVFTAPADTVQLHFLSDTAAMKIHSMKFCPTKDTLVLWYKNLMADSLSFVWFNGKENDTIVGRLFKNDPEKKGRKFSLDMKPANAAPGMQEMHMPFVLNANHLLAKVDPSFVTLTKDSVPMKDFALGIDSATFLSAIIYFKPDVKSNYAYTILPGAFEDIYGVKNDTLKFGFSYRDEAQFGSLVVKYAGAGDNNILQLVSEKGDVVREVKFSGSSSITFSNMEPATYRLKFIADANHNGKWDSGDYLRHIQPEETRFYPDKIVLRANWDVDVRWDLGN